VRGQSLERLSMAQLRLQFGALLLDAPALQLSS
jgi:hypothetical protein